jgi:hypothetical protein
MSVKTFDPMKHWVGMPAYEPGKKAPELRVRFRTQRDKKRFIRYLGLAPAPGKEGSAWWPPRRQQDDVRSVLFEG